jgi:hypothetical protein
MGTPLGGVDGGTRPAEGAETSITTLPTARHFILNLFTLDPFTLDLVTPCPPHWTARA